MRGYTNKVRFRGLRKIEGLKPTKAGFACVNAVYNRRFHRKLILMRTVSHQIR